MFRLQLLGGLHLEGPGNRPLGRAAQRRRLALLTVLARAPRRTATRDRLIGLLWPECTTEEARHRLSSALYDLRQALGAEALASPGDEVSLAFPLSVDAELFEGAVAAGHWNEAVARYPGPFLDGVHIDDAEEFERWVDAERDKLERLVQRARAAIDGLAGAVQPGSSFSPPAVIPLQRLPPVRRRPLSRLLAAAALLILTCGVIWSTAGDTSVAGAAFPVRVAVFPFRVTGPVPIPNLSHGLVDLLSLDLDGAGDLRTVDPNAVLAGLDPGSTFTDQAAQDRARRLGANRLVSGTVQGSTAGIRIRATMYSTTTGAVEAEAFIEGTPDRLLDLVDRVSASLVAGRLKTAGEHLARVGAVSTTSLPALKAWLAGETAFREGKYGIAADAFETATHYDSTFALAHYRHSLATLWGDRPGASTEFHDAAALRHAKTLAPRERQLLEAYAAWRNGNAAEAESRYRRILTIWPDDVEGWQQLGETQFHYNPRRGKPVAEARETFERVLALDPNHQGAEWHLALLHALDGKRDAFVQGLERLQHSPPDNLTTAGEINALLRETRPDPPAVGGTSALEAGNVNSLFALAWRMAVFVGDLGGAERVSRRLIDPRRDDYARLLGHSNLSVIAAAQGRLRAALAELRAAPVAGPDFNPGIGAAGLLTRWGDGFSRPERIAMRDSLLRNPPHPGTASAPSVTFLTALLQLQLGDAKAARAEISRLHDLQTDPVLAYHLTRALQALQAEQNGHHQETLRLLQDDSPLGWFGLAVSGNIRADPMLRFVRAEALFALGRDEEAAGWYQSLGEHALRDLVYLAPSHFRRGQILERQGRIAEAREHFAAVVNLWSGADPELQSLVAQARSRLGGRLAQQTPLPAAQPR